LIARFTITEIGISAEYLSAITDATSFALKNSHPVIFER